MLVVASGVCASSTPTARAERSGRARAVTSRRTAAQVVSPRWRSSATGGPMSNAAFGASGRSAARSDATGDRGAAGESRFRTAVAARIAATSEERERRALHPVNFGLRRLRVRRTKCVSATIASVLRFERGSSKASAAGEIPASRRIQAACRASTEWIASAGTR